MGLTMPLAREAACEKASDRNQLRVWLEQAETLGLANDPGWLRLLHFRGGSSTIEAGSGFFLSAQGATDSDAELHETLGSFSADGAAGCRYPARQRWLEGRLDPFPAPAKDAQCPELDRWRSRVPADEAFLVFADALPSSPPSMFGHTLLRLSGPKDPGVLGYGVSFVARTGSDGGLRLLARGLFGDYGGSFHVEPYYRAIRQYNRWEDRDLWEHRLTLEPEEVALIVDHLFELRRATFKYRFLDDNCSLGLLSLLEVARPSVDLVDGFSLWTIPAETVRRVADEGMIQSAVYRPSLATRIRAALEQLPDSEARQAEALALGASSMTQEVPPRVMATASLIRRHAKWREDVPSNRLPSAGRAPAPKMLLRNGLVDGHGSSRYRLASGTRDGRPFIELGYRPALHDLLDPPPGYRRGLQIEVLDTSIRYFPEESRVALSKLTLLDVFSMEPRGTYLEPLSWRFRTRVEARMPPRTRTDRGVGNGMVAEVDFALGGTWRLRPSLVASLLSRVSVEAARRLAPAYSTGPGLEGILIYGPDNGRWQGRLRASGQALVAGHARTRAQIEWSHRISLGRRWSIRGSFSWNRDFSNTWFDTRVGLDLFL